MTQSSDTLSGESVLHRRDNNPEIRIYRGSQTFDLADLFSGLELTTDQIFAIPEWALR